ncbi:PLP-dependent transferase [Hymenopellis radicata]|nr:PLP-dependent transferase [Hymenopellis radicata]
MAIIENVPLGHCVPPRTPFAISVSFPTWEDNIGYIEGDRRVHDRMVSGYPRFVVPPNVVKVWLSVICTQKFGKGKACMLFPSQRCADECATFLRRHSIDVTVECYIIRPAVVLYITLYAPSPESKKVAKSFWQHTGLGISARFADYCLAFLENESHDQQAFREFCCCKPLDIGMADQIIYEESQEGRIHALTCGESAKRVVKRRILDLIRKDVELEECDVVLFPTGMSAIWNVHQLASSVSPGKKAICFGFPYTDTLKVLEKWGPGARFFSAGDEEDLDELEKELKEAYQRDPSVPPFTSLFTEFPSNPLLRSVDLKRLSALAQKYGFPIIVDDTIGNFVNVDVLRHVDIVVSSLSKLFSGAANVMGGSVVFNPRRRHYTNLKTRMEQIFEDNYFAQDADFRERVRKIDANAEAVCDFLRSRSGSILVDVLYPKFVTRELYDRYRSNDGGFGGLFTLVFTSQASSIAFYDALEVYKGPSLGTNFTLACPYTILAHYGELEWAASCGVGMQQVRISVGLEDAEYLLGIMAVALDAAESRKM